MTIRKSVFAFLSVGFVLVLMLPAAVQASTVECDKESTTKNYMLVDASIVSACLDAGFNNPSLTGNTSGSNPDVFLTGEGTSYTNIDTTTFVVLSQSTATSTGTFSFDSSLWSTYSQLAVGFKFGTGNQPDNWFVYSLDPSLTSGNWEWTFMNVNGRGGGLSGVRLYGVTGTTVPEPGSLALLLVGIAALGAARKASAPSHRPTS